MSFELPTITNIDNEFEIAEEEYFENLVFDDRLHDLLDLSNSVTKIHFATSTLMPDGIISKFIQPNSTQLREISLDDDHIEYIQLDAFAFQLDATINEDPSSLFFDITITPDREEDNALRIISSHPSEDVFYVSSFGSDEKYLLTSKEFFSTLLSLAGAKKKNIDTVLNQFGESFNMPPYPFKKQVFDLLYKMGTEYGTVDRETTIEHVITNENEGTETTTRIDFYEKEDPRASIIEMVLSHVVERKQLDVSELHQLKTTLKNIKTRDQSKEAIKKVLSGPTAHLLNSVAVLKSKGEVKKLDPLDPSVKELFVDWFDELMAA